MILRTTSSPALLSWEMDLGYGLTMSRDGLSRTHDRGSLRSYHPSHSLGRARSSMVNGHYGIFVGGGGKWRQVESNKGQ